MPKKSPKKSPRKSPQRGKSRQKPAGGAPKKSLDARRKSFAQAGSTPKDAGENKQDGASNGQGM